MWTGIKCQHWTGQIKPVLVQSQIPHYQQPNNTSYKSRSTVPQHYAVLWYWKHLYAVSQSHTRYLITVETIKLKISNHQMNNYVSWIKFSVIGPTIKSENVHRMWPLSYLIHKYELAKKTYFIITNYVQL